jgi:methylated-DNA-[protein]-cysteine S-methyltransferase
VVVVDTRQKPELENQKRRKRSMTPSGTTVKSTTVKSKAMNSKKHARTINTPIGRLLIETNNDAVTLIELPGSATIPKTATSGDSSGDPTVMKAAVAQLTEYFAGERKDFELPLELEGTDFQRDVWMTLADIPYGATVSYAELATMVGRPSAFRAVGQANGANPIPIVLPCHRVVASGGGLGGYGGGLDMKRRLLAIEGVEIF